MKRTNINKLRMLNTGKFTQRYYRWFTEGKRDGMCGVYRDLSAVPKLYREGYNNGHTYGMLSREAAYSEYPALEHIA